MSATLVCFCCRDTSDGTMLTTRPTQALVIKRGWSCTDCAAAWQVRLPAVMHALKAAQQVVLAAIARNVDPLQELHLLMARGLAAFQPQVWLDVIEREIAYHSRASNVRTLLLEEGGSAFTGRHGVAGQPAPSPASRVPAPRSRSAAG